MAELIEHGWKERVDDVSSRLLIVELTSDEEEYALRIAEQITQHSHTPDVPITKHRGEAQAIVLALRTDYRNDVLLLDELAARALARQQNIKLSGFPGVLLLAVQGSLISAEELRRRLEICRNQGTHYGAKFIEQVYNMAKEGRR